VVSPPSKPAGVLRLTRRGRLVGLLMIVAIAYGAFGLGRASAAPANLANRPQSVVVQTGDSLWSIAERTMPGQDPRDAVAKIESLNRLTSAQVDVGQQLRIR
jgi:LysM domain